MSSSIQNRIKDLEQFRKEFACPDIKGTFEIHIFMVPTNPEDNFDEIVEQYIEVTEQLNKERRLKDPNCNLIKPCLLALDFRGKGYVTVMQSSRYCVCPDLETAVTECNKEADLYLEKFREQNVPITIIREKLETLACSHGVPVTDEEAQKYPKYFEFHIRVARKNEDTESRITNEELEELSKISKKFTEQFGTPVPLSYNKIRDQQRYLNVRFSGIGSETARARVAAIVEAIKQSEYFKWIKTIAEYVPYDSFRALDKGWIDFDDFEN